MADQTSRGFRKFIMDPKSSVMTYIADNIPSEHLSHQQESHGRLPHGGLNGQQYNAQDPNRLQQNSILSQNSQGQVVPNLSSQLSSQFPSSGPSYAQPVQSTQLPIYAPYIASNVNQEHGRLDGYAGGQGQHPGNTSITQGSLSQQDTQNHGSQATTTVGQGPPPPGARRRNSPQSAPRLYHRLVLEYETTKKVFFAAKSRKTPSPHHIWSTDL